MTTEAQALIIELDRFGREVETDIAEHRGDGIGRGTVGDQHGQRLRIVDAAVGVEDEEIAGHSGYLPGLGDAVPEPRVGFRIG